MPMALGQKNGAQRNTIIKVELRYGFFINKYCVALRAGLFSWRASYSICQNPICPCTTLVAWVGTPRSIQRGVLDSGHGRSIQRGVLDRWMHSRTVSMRKKLWKKIQLNRPALFNAQNFETETLESSDFSMYPIFDEQAFDSKSCQSIAHYT